ncbi:MAG: hypothetical protein MI864_26225 [Pseudomonadales bacterium]|nr:hypothetical protein [Pseudomonadales bacterium]
MMIQETLKNQLNALQEMGGKLQSEVAKGTEIFTEEGYRILSELTGTKISASEDLQGLYDKIKGNNPSLKRLLLNLDVATYDTRKKLRWNATMMAAYGKNQAEKAYENDLKPKLNSYVDMAETQFKALAEKVETLKPKAGQ